MCFFDTENPEDDEKRPSSDSGSRSNFLQNRFAGHASPQLCKQMNSAEQSSSSSLHATAMRSSRSPDGERHHTDCLAGDGDDDSDDDKDDSDADISVPYIACKLSLT